MTDNFQSISVVSLTPIEHEAYARNPAIRNVVDQVGNMVMDLLADDDVMLTILFALPDPDNEKELSLAFSGSTLSLEISPEYIEIVDFNDGDEEVLETFRPDQINAATTWLVNRANPA